MATEAQKNLEIAIAKRDKEIAEEELNLKIAEFVWPGSTVECNHGLGSLIIHEKGQVDAIVIRLFTRSLDALEQHVLPKLSEMGYEVEVSWCGFNKAMVALCPPKLDGMLQVLGETAAMAWCLAVKRLIDSLKEIEK